ncbi:capsular polysaccharide biosynthesis protein [Conservatibacter flavescens]|uniref:Beta-3-deoxy-D-manno-oct-2-ulosonic acid transferase n=1 Tax=Conservatibacter flavescens TaxID=28161 RepID=A0A2M8S520_9PAST|nr:capsular polysaccharide biosynthesis protein [Conservatibacter flavescens]PJG86239.1 beta-3-deoxy-D-manno-oct-2-ulosonic acid transferase [Conservatibacter flavescens]
MSQSLIFSRGLLAIPHLKVFLPECELCTYSVLRKPPKVEQVIGWGLRPTTRRARSYARQHNLPFVALEDGFLRSVGLGVEGYPPFSLVYDDIGIYYDTTRSSRLEQLILKSGELSEHFLADSQRAMDLICQYQLSKYNHAPDMVFDGSVERQIVLVVDQTFGDMAVKYGQADETCFIQMLQAAIAENPTSEIWVKTHPDVISGKKQGYLTALSTVEPQVKLVAEDVNPLSLLARVNKVYCVTSQMGFEALLLHKPVVTFGVPWFAGWGLTDDRHPNVALLQKNSRRKDRSLLQLFACAYLQYSRYLNPYTQQSGTIFDVINYLHQGKLLNDRLRGDLYSVGMSLWKRAVIKPFFRLPSCRLHFVSSVKQLAKKHLPADGRLLIWGVGKSEVLEYAKQQNVTLLHMEDGFIRSVGLGSNLVAPLSLVIDDLGIYFDPRCPSRLEVLLQHHQFSPQDKIQAERLQQKLIQSHIGKYNVGQLGLTLQGTTKKMILVPGQVEDDASIRFGSPDVVKNLDLLKKVRLKNPTDFIIYKPHPDVVSGNRIGYIEASEVLKYADQIVVEANILECIQQVDEVHTMTSLAGFEALLRGKKVYCYGLPFYANWGLTVDEIQLPRRQRQLALWELIAAVLIYYPQYIDPKTKHMIQAEQAIDILVKQKQQQKGDGLSRSWMLKQWGKLVQLCSVLR